MVTAIASWVLLFGAPEDALACHRGDPHGSATSCDGGGEVDLTNLVMVDANGDVVGSISNLDEARAHVIVLTPDQRPFRLEVELGRLRVDLGWKEQGSPSVFYEELGCLDTDTALLAPLNAVPNIFHEVALIPDGAGGLVPWVGTSFENPSREYNSQIASDGSCFNHAPPLTPDGPEVPAEDEDRLKLELNFYEGEEAGDVDLIWPGNLGAVVEWSIPF